MGRLGPLGLVAVELVAMVSVYCGTLIVPSCNLADAESGAFTTAVYMGPCLVAPSCTDAGTVAFTPL